MDASARRRPEPNDARETFAALMRLRDDDLPLDRAAALLARGVAYPDLDVERVLADLDVLAAELRDRLPRTREPRAMVTALSGYLAGELGFRGNERDYYDPRNSFLNEILARRTGLPIGLALVYLEVARRVEFPLVGVGTPFHFVVKHPAGGDIADDIYLDPFAAGAVLTPAELRERIVTAYGRVVAFQEHHLAAVTKKQLLTRLLTNLKAYYVGNNQPRHAREVVEYLLLIAPWDLEQRRDRGLLTLQLGDPKTALADLETYERFTADADDLPIVRHYIDELRRRFGQQ